MKTAFNNKNLSPWFDRRGFSLMELLMVVALSGLVLSGVGISMNLLSSANLEFSNDQAVASHRTEVRSLLSKSSRTTAAPQCMTSLESRLTPSMLNKAIQIATAATPSREVIELGVFNILNAASLDYGSLTVERVTLENILLVKADRGYNISKPSEVTVADMKPVLMYTLSANLTTYLRAKSKTDPIRSQLRFKMVVLRSTASRTLLDCGTGNLGRTTAIVDACKSFGEDFEYFIDRHNGSEFAGQCYAPIYDTAKQVGAFIADGNRRAQVTGYTPLRGFLCESLIQGKSFDFPFCTGVN